METTYVRTRGGLVIHRRTCSWLAAGGVTNPAKITPWPWAEGMTVAEINATQAALNLGLRFCKVCCPEAVQ